MDRASVACLEPRGNRRVESCGRPHREHAGSRAVFMVSVSLCSHHPSSGRLLMSESFRFASNVRRFPVKCQVDHLVLGGRASVRLLDVGNSKFRNLKLEKFMRSDIKAFEQAHCQVCWQKLYMVEVKWCIFKIIVISGKIYGNAHVGILQELEMSNFA